MLTPISKLLQSSTSPRCTVVMCDGLLCVRQHLAAPPAPAQVGSDGTNMIVPMGVVLGCVTMAGMVLMLWLFHRRMDRSAGAHAGQAADEGGGRSLEPGVGEPHLPKLPVIIVLPDNKTLSLGWQLEHTACASPTASSAAEGSCASGRVALEGSKQAADGSSGPCPRAAFASSTLALGAGTGSAMYVAPAPTASAGLTPAGGSRKLTGGSRRRPPLISVVVLGPDHTPVGQPPMP
ncbi:hypothetical protein ABPG77_002923 [Micractinium sp. CCAP 211/92]